MTLVYLYSIAPAQAAGWLLDNEVLGIGDAPVRPLVEGNLSGIVNDVPSADFDQEPLDRNVADPSWLGLRAASHQEVNARLHAGLGAVIPLAFGTVFRSDEGIRRVLRERGTELSQAMRAVADRVEWVLTLERDHLVLDASLDQSAELQRLDSEARASPPGRAYLMGRKRQEARRQEARSVVVQAREAFGEALAPVAETVTDEPLVEGGPVARLTVLLARKGEVALQGAVDAFNEEWAERGFTVRGSGPWPPYRFGARVGALHE